MLLSKYHTFLSSNNLVGEYTDKFDINIKLLDILNKYVRELCNIFAIIFIAIVGLIIFTINISNNNAFAFFFGFFTILLLYKCFI